MTLVIAAQGHDFVVLGCDSRATIENADRTKVALDMLQKLTQLTDRAGILLFGDACQAHYFLETYKQQTKTNLKNVTAVAEDFAQFCRGQLRLIKDIRVNHDPLFGFVIAGIDIVKDQIIPKSFTLDNTTSFQLGTCGLGFNMRGKIILPNYIFAKKYTNKMDVDKLTDLVVYTINDTIQYDGDVGGKINVAIIDSRGMRMIPDSDVERKIERSNMHDLSS